MAQHVLGKLFPVEHAACCPGAQGSSLDMMPDTSAPLLFKIKLI